MLELLLGGGLMLSLGCNLWLYDKYVKERYKIRKGKLDIEHSIKNMAFELKRIEEQLDERCN